MKELIDLSKVQSWVSARWKNSLGLVIALLIGVMLGTLTTEWRVIDDCRYLKNFRFGTQSFSCMRTM